jgi:GNAT superfamily N-acetyltransferase
MRIRLANTHDGFALSALLTELGYANTEVFIERRLAQLIDDRAEQLLIAEQGSTVLGFLSLHFIPQLALAGDFARISYFCIADGKRSEGVGQQLLSHAEKLAKAHGCDRMEVHCHEQRTKANAFYSREGYSEAPRYLIKNLDAHAFYPHGET